MSKHSALPWVQCASNNCPCGLIWSEPGDHPVMKVIFGDWGDETTILTPTNDYTKYPLGVKPNKEMIVYGSINEENAAANVKFIVEACNNYEEILQMCSSLLLWIRMNGTRETTEQFKPFFEKIKQLTSSDPFSVELNENYWDCECSEKFIHPNEMLWCPYCLSLKEDQPNSQAHEVSYKKMIGDKSIDIVLPKTDDLDYYHSFVAGLAEKKLQSFESRILDGILQLIGNVDHSKGNGTKSAKMRGDLLNDIRNMIIESKKCYDNSKDRD